MLGRIRLTCQVSEKNHSVKPAQAAILSCLGAYIGPDPTGLLNAIGDFGEAVYCRPSVSERLRDIVELALTWLIAGSNPATEHNRSRM